jgi:predicted transposase/invertase (TIGR01784 family)
MTTFIHQPHDKLFKLSMGEIIVAREFFVANLPSSFLAKMNLDTLKLEKNSFIDELYKATEADVLYSVKTEDSLCYLYLLCEHQSKIDKLMSFRLMVYVFRVMEMHLKQYPDAALPLVYPIVIYSGEKPWDAPLEIYSLFDHEEMAREYLFKPYQLLDIHRVNDDELLKQQLWGVVAFALKKRQTQDVVNFFKELFDSLKNLCIAYPNSKIPEIVVEYTMNMRGEEEIEQFKQIAQRYLSSNTGELLMGTIADVYRRQAKEEVWQQASDKGRFEGRLKGILEGIVEGRFQGLLEGRAEGRVEGRVEGRAEGRVEGRLEGRLEGNHEGQVKVFIQILKARFETIPSIYTKHIETANEETLLGWTLNIFNAQTLDEVFKIHELTTGNYSGV